VKPGGGPAMNVKKKSNSGLPRKSGRLHLPLFLFNVIDVFLKVSSRKKSAMIAMAKLIAPTTKAPRQVHPG
jgi:hypothetical protein